MGRPGAFKLLVSKGRKAMPDFGELSPSLDDMSPEKIRRPSRKGTWSRVEDEDAVEETIKRVRRNKDNVSRDLQKEKTKTGFKITYKG